MIRIGVSRRIGAIILVGTLALGAGLLDRAASAAAPASNISITAVPSLINYVEPDPTKTQINGRLSPAKGGVTVELQERTWPFTSPFATVSQRQTSSDGSFGFTRHPSLAAEYRVLAPGLSAQSSTETVHVLHGYAVTGCKLFHNGKNYGCGQHSNQLPQGTYKYQFSFDFLYPPRAYAMEKDKPVFVYFALNEGSSRPPQEAKLEETVSQQPRGGDQTHVFVKLYFTIGKHPAFWQGFVCTQTSERQDGLGREGLPGAYHCGDETITYSEARGSLG